MAAEAAGRHVQQHVVLGCTCVQGGALLVTGTNERS